MEKFPVEIIMESAKWTQAVPNTVRQIRVFSEIRIVEGFVIPVDA